MGGNMYVSKIRYPISAFPRYSILVRLYAASPAIVVANTAVHAATYTLLPRYVTYSARVKNVSKFSNVIRDGISRGGIVMTSGFGLNAVSTIQNTGKIRSSV